MNNWKFVIYKDKSNKYRFRLVASNGQIILASEAYNSLQAIHKGIKSVKINSKERSNYDKKDTKNGNHYFNLFAKNKKILGTSERYVSTSGREIAISAIIHNAHSAIIEEL